MEAAPTRRNTPPAILAGIALLGAGVAVAIGVYAGEHTPTGRSILGDGLFFTATINMKVWFATAVAVLALFQVYAALRMWDRVRIPREMPAWIAPAHRISGTAAFLISLPVAYHCVWALGLQVSEATTRVAVHGLLGCFFYGAFAAKMLFLRVERLPGLTLPIVGGLTFSAVIGIWLTSSLWFFDNFGFPQF